MRLTLPVLLLAAAASAQTAPAVSTSGSEFKNHVEVGYARAAYDAAPDDFAGFHAEGRYFVSGGFFLAIEHLSVDVYNPSLLGSVEIDRTGFGVGHVLPIGPGRLVAAATYGQLKLGLSGVSLDSLDQTRLSLAYEQKLLDALTVSLEVAHSLNASTPSSFDLTSYAVGLGYEIGKGFSIQATYSPDSAVLGLDGRDNGSCATLGLRYSF